MIYSGLPVQAAQAKPLHRRLSLLEEEPLAWRLQNLSDSGVPFTLLEREEQLADPGIYAGRLRCETALQSQLNITDSVEDALNERNTFTNGDNRSPICQEA